MAKAPKYMPGQLPLFAPESDWKPLAARDWPDLRGNAKLIGCDTETADPQLKTKGPGFIRKDAFVCGISLASEDGQKIYLPIGHVEGNCEDVDQVKRYVAHQLGGDQVKCGANLMYDMEALWSLGIELKGPLGDIQIAEPMLDEDRAAGYSLEALAKTYLGAGKTEGALDEAALAYSVDSKKGMYWIPPKFVHTYAENDALFPVQIFQLQTALMKEDNVWSIFELERRLQRTLFKMRLRGVRIDVDKAEQLSKALKLEEAELESGIHRELGSRVNLSSGPALGLVLKNMGIHVPTTAKGALSITNEWLKEQTNPVCQKIMEWKKTIKMRRDFIDTLAEDSVNGRIYSNWHQLRETDEDSDDTKGTRSGRVAASKFNLTQVPSRDPKWGKLIRGLFVADHGGRWVKADYSQQEPRILLHFAYMMGYEGAAEARQRYLDDPSTDYHQLVADLVEERTGEAIGRRPAKDINLGSAYGMGKDKLALKLGVTKLKAEEILEAYHAGVPYVKKLEKACTERATERGFVTTILKRKRRFPLWEKASYGPDKSYETAPTYEEAVKRWGNQVRRAFCHKSLNAIVQGSAADQMKQALVMLDDEGLLPQIQVYDEINGTYHEDHEIKRLQEIMENSIPMSVPFIAEPDVGTSWGDAKAWVPA